MPYRCIKLAGLAESHRCERLGRLVRWLVGKLLLITFRVPVTRLYSISFDRRPISLCLTFGHAVFCWDCSGSTLSSHPAEVFQDIAIPSDHLAHQLREDPCFQRELVLKASPWSTSRVRWVDRNGISRSFGSS